MGHRNFSRLTCPRALKPGDALGIASPASPFDRSAFEAGVKILENMGFKVVMPDDVFVRQGYLAGADRQRAGQLMRLFEDPEIDGIICARGGYGAMRILEFLNSAAIVRHPKPFIGFSDITALLGFLTDHCGVVAFHGPTVTTLAASDSASQDQFFETVTGRSTITIAANPPVELVAGKCHGRFVCGNLTLFSHLTGTTFQPNLSGCILMIEDRGEALYRIDRMLTQMRLADSLDRLAGLALGDFSGCALDEDLYDLIHDRLGDLGIPILAGFPVGHGTVNLTLPVGLNAFMDTAAGTLAFTEPALI